MRKDRHCLWPAGHRTEVGHSPARHAKAWPWHPRVCQRDGPPRRAEPEKRAPPPRSPRLRVINGVEGSTSPKTALGCRRRPQGQRGVKVTERVSLAPPEGARHPRWRLPIAAYLAAGFGGLIALAVGPGPGLSLGTARRHPRGAVGGTGPCP